MRRTKIVCTLGPATDADSTLDRLIAAGMNVARINMSHGTRDSAAAAFARVRERSRIAGAHVAVLVDLQGPKIRTGALVGGEPVTLRAGDTVSITTQPIEGTAERISTGYAGLPNDVRPGDRILLSDGLIELRAESVSAETVLCRVVEGGVLRERQGINLPGSEVAAPSLTPKDEADLTWAVHVGADYLAVSFVRRAEDVLAAKRLVDELGADTPVIAKLEKPHALAQLDAILGVADGVMVARGDMGVELPPEQVPVWQKRIIAAANARMVPVITATQMLESMVREPRPTRAEATDVANAIWDGTDAVMLSAETSIGSYPVEAVRMMERIACAAEAEPAYLQARTPHQHDSLPHAISLATRTIASVVPELRAVAAFTRNGATARLVSKDRPAVPILGFCVGDSVARRLALYHGVLPIPWEGEPDLVAMLRAVEGYGPSVGGLARGDVVAVLGHLPADLPGSTNMLLLHQLRDTPAAPPTTTGARASRAVTGESVSDTQTHGPTG